ncbi:hypothetical protein NBRC116585_29250 [Thalassolituus maritimus]|uniref:Uncharacterized protein n=1 Tax=Thalassolituus maritimus TaxID=484498 RepID=A0ABQ0A344_9GAMM
MLKALTMPEVILYLQFECDLGITRTVIVRLGISCRVFTSKDIGGNAVDQAVDTLFDNNSASNSP